MPRVKPYAIKKYSYLENLIAKEDELLGLKKARTAQGLSQTDLASKLGVNVSTIVRWEKGTKHPDLLTLKELSKELNHSIDFLANGKEFQGR